MTPRRTAAPKPPKEPNPALAHFTHEARDQAYELWLRERGAISYPRLVRALAPCWRHDVWGTTDQAALDTLEWALACSTDRIGVTPEFIAADWARWRKLMRLDPWQRYSVLMRLTRAD